MLRDWYTLYTFYKKVFMYYIQACTRHMLAVSLHISRQSPACHQIKIRPKKATACQRDSSSAITGAVWAEVLSARGLKNPILDHQPLSLVVETHFVVIWTLHSHAQWLCAVKALIAGYVWQCMQKAFMSVFYFIFEIRLCTKLCTCVWTDQCVTSSNPSYIVCTNTRADDAKHAQYHSFSQTVIQSRWFSHDNTRLTERSLARIWFNHF